MNLSPLILASKSAIRREILANAGLSFTCIDSGVDEDIIKQDHLGSGASPEDLPRKLAAAKALRARDIAANTGQHESGSILIGADQILEMDGTVFDKPKDMDEARARLLAMRGKPHRLIGSVCAMTLGGADTPDWEHTAITNLWVREFSETFLDAYLKAEGESLLFSVGAYKFEGLGSQLFKRVEGDFFSVLGLPLLPLLAYLRSVKAVRI